MGEVPAEELDAGAQGTAPLKDSEPFLRAATQRVVRSVARRGSKGFGDGGVNFGGEIGSSGIFLAQAQGKQALGLQRGVTFAAKLVQFCLKRRIVGVTPQQGNQGVYGLARIG
ncbi:MAG: hypothetical protein IT572_08890 [Deltaproteobacteria bacterium]|nr:hypothetical protein [Deltaproteobacteria bacterium]